MNLRDRQNPLTLYIATTKIFLLIATVFLFLFWIVCNLVLPKEHDAVHTNYRIFDASWEQVTENGDRIPISVPGKVPAKFGEMVTITTTLPQDIQPGEQLCFRPIWQDVTISIDGELRKSYTTKDSRPFGLNSPMRYLFVELQETDEGKELTYQFTSQSKYAGDIRTVYIGDLFSIWLNLIQESGIRAIIALFLALLSLFCILVCLVLKFVYKKTFPLNYLAWTIFFCALWMLSEVTFRQIITTNVSVLANYAYWSLMLIPIPLLIYINEVQNNCYQKIYFFPLTYCVVIFVVNTFLQIFDIAQFVQTLPLVHIGLVASILCIIATIAIDTIKKRISNYLFVGIGLYGMLFSSIMELLLYYLDANPSLDMVLSFGLLFLLIMAIFKTGQDLFHSEKKKQQAIVAKDAQAKFLANMSHEIRTPINAIIGMNEMILRENENDAILDYARNIESASNMLLGLINDVLDFSKIESGQLELVEDTYDLTTLLQDEILLLRTRAANKPIAIHIDVDSSLPSKLYGDELRIKQILTNLLSNAVKYTEQGSVTLKAGLQQTASDTIHLIFSITDTGIGIRQEDLSKLFDSFKRLDIKKNRAVEGTGLGLNIAKQLVELMQGTLQVESEYGHGSTFTISIPQKIMDKQAIGRFDDHNSHRKNTHASESLFTAPSARILVVDDNAMNLTLMKELLKRTKIEVDLAASGKECLEMTKNKAYHIIFMDHMMPEMDGVETLHKLKEEHFNPNKNAIVIALTANAIAGCHETYLNYGFHDYFAKPVLADKLEALLLKYLPDELVQRTDEASQTNAEKVKENESSSTSEQTNTAELLTIDHQAGLSYCLESEDLYQNVLAAFLKQTKQYVEELDSYVQAGDWKNYAIITHGIKSSSLNIGATEFSKLSLQHELAGKEENETYIRSHYPEYSHLLKELLRKAEELLL